MSEAVLVDIDARSLAAAGGNWTYDNHAALIDRLAQVGASTVVYAVPLAPPATPTDAQGAGEQHRPGPKRDLASGICGQR